MGQDLSEIYICSQCENQCGRIIHEWKEKEEFWGAPCWRTEQEWVSECCGKEVNTAQECQENGWPAVFEE